MLPDPFRGMGARKNSAETQQSGHALRPGPEVKNGNSVKDGAPERLRCGTIQEEVHQRLAASTWWCGSRPSIREVGRNGEAIFSRGPSIQSPPNVWNLERVELDWRAFLERRVKLEPDVFWKESSWSWTFRDRLSIPGFNQMFFPLYPMPKVFLRLSYHVGKTVNFLNPTVRYKQSLQVNASIKWPHHDLHSKVHK